MEKLLAGGIAKQKSPGVCAVIYENGHENYYSYGLANISEKKAIDRDTQFEIGSITKSFIALLVMLAEEEGLISVNDPIEKFFPEGTKIPHGKNNKIKIKDLLAHTSGLPIFPTNIDTRNEIQSLLNYSETDLIDFFQNYSLKKEPGTSFRYSSLGYGILGYILEKIYNRSLNRLCLDKITIPLGMDRTSINYAAHSDNNYADGYLDGDILNLYRKDFMVSDGFGGLRSTARDLLIYMKAQAGIIKTPLYSTMQKTQEVQFRNDGEMICNGWFKVKEFLLYAGATRGFSSIVVLDSETNKIFVMLANSRNEKWVTGVAGKVMGY